MTSKQKSQPEALALDAAAMAKLYADIAEKSGNLIGKFMSRAADKGMPAMSDELGIAKAFFDAWGLMFADPLRVAELQMKLWQDYLALWQNSMLKMMGQAAEPVAQPHKTDRRFRHDDWENNFLYDYVKQSYLIAARHLHHSLARVEGLDDKTAKKVDFYTRQYIDALSPSNFLLTNPEATANS
jgi:polyhydroxyalkanoate synthase